MIDLDQLDNQLESALAENLRAPEDPVPSGRHRTPRPPRAPRSPRPAITARVADPQPERADREPDSDVHDAPSSHDPGGRIARLVRAGRLPEADLLIASHAETAHDGGPLDRRDAAAWVTMRALLDGRPDAAHAASETVLRLGREGNDERAWPCHLVQRFWLVLDWGDEDAHYDLLDQCREQAYTYGDVSWRGALTVLLARLGRHDEACRELDATVVDLGGLPSDATWLDIVTNLAEAAAALGDAERARGLQRLLARVPDQLVLGGPAWVCKGSLARYRAGLAATTGSWTDADAGFRAAVDALRAAGARPLLAQTLHQWGTGLAGRDDLLSRRCLQESADLNRSARPGRLDRGAAHVRRIGGHR